MLREERVTELWEWIEGYEGVYAISELGRVWSDRNSMMLRSRKDRDGYSSVTLNYKGKRKTLKVHRLVAIAFLDNPNGYKEVNHKNLNRSDNYKDNLEWTTRKANCNNKKAVTKRRGKSVVLQIDGDEIVMIYRCLRDTEKFGFNHRRISVCCNGRQRIHRGFEWKYQSDIEI